MHAAVVCHESDAEALALFVALRAQDAAKFREIRWSLVHNGGDESWERLKSGFEREFPGSVNATLARIANRGYGAALNGAFAGSVAPALLGLNSDLLPGPGFLAELLEQARAIADEKSRIGIVGLALEDEDGKPQGSFGPAPTLTNLVLGLRKPPAARKYSLPAGAPAQDVDWVTGANILMNAACYRELGGFDERFFMYYEDADLCRRAKALGWRTRFVPKAPLRHLHPFHERGLSASMAKLSRPSLVRYFRRHRPWWEYRAALALVRFECRKCGAAWNGVREAIEATVAELERG
ncbi:MAG TPA: glycosyltransferase family 2 protein [Planctomycetia bacterium]|nr:glycosyltransferase family 2 protein [Planctomycetia bacterium]